jgi:hypothetical protein
MTNDLTIQDLFKGKSTIIKNKEFFPTKTYVEPFLERMSKFTDKFSIQVKLPDQMTFSKDSQDITYNRVLVQAQLPEKYCIENHDEVIGFIYGLDVKKPIAKIYRGYLNRACTNLTVFDPQWIEIQELIPGEPLRYNSIKSLMEYTSNIEFKLKEMKSTYLNREDRTQYLGEWVDRSLRYTEDYGFGKVKIAVSTPVDAYRELFINRESEYFIPEGIDPSLFDVYNSFTQIITDDSKDLMNKAEKTLLVGKLLKVV